MKVKLINKVITSNYGEELLKERGIEDVEKFLNPTESCLQSWKDLVNIEKGIKLIKNLKEDCYIGLVVDCDMDGFTSAAILYQYLNLVRPQCKIKTYLHEGKAHGLEDIINSGISDEPFDLFLIPDAGSQDGCYIKDFSCPVLVLDHHIVEENSEFPDNMILINNQISPNYQNKFLSGAGIVYQFCRGLDEKLNVIYSENFIDLAALGIVSDVMSGLEYENQYIWKKGFSNIQNYFFQTLCEKQAYSMGNKINPTTVAFYITPLVNALIRVGTMDEKQRLFQAFINGHSLVPSNKRGEKGKMVEVAIESARECTNARVHQNKIKDQVIEDLDFKIQKNELLDHKLLYVKLDEEEEFPNTLTGLVAMGLAAKYKRPALVGRVNEQGEVKGSLRNTNNSALPDLKGYLDSTNLMLFTAGHANAAGQGIMQDKIPQLLEKSDKELATYDFGENFYPVEFEINGNSDNLKSLIYDLAKLEPIWSTNCNEPLIHITGLNFNAGDYTIMGTRKDTIKFVKNGISYIKFFAKDLIQELSQYNEFSIEIVGKAKLNEWMGNVTPQIFIEDYEIAENNIISF